MGALAPPVASEELLPEPPELASPPAVEPPVASLEALPLELLLSLDFDASLSLSPSPCDELDSPLAGVVVEPVVGVVVVEVVSVASFSAAVLLGGVMSGVLLGVTSETLVLPHALSPSAERASTAAAEHAAR